MVEDTKKYRQHISTTTAAFGFYVLTFCFLKIAIDLYHIYNNKPRQNPVLFTVAFSLIFGIFMYSRNLEATKNDLICGNADHSIAMGSTLLPFVIIYVLTVICLHIFPGWQRCFSNTFGTGFVNVFLSLNETMVDWIKIYNTNIGEDGSNHNLDTISYMMKRSPETLFNELEDNYEISGDTKIWPSFDVVNAQLQAKFPDAQNATPEVADKMKSVQQTLLLYVSIKNAIGLCIWLYGIGMITLQVGFNAMLSQDCSSFKRSHTEVQEYIRERLKK